MISNPVSSLSPAGSSDFWAGMSLSLVLEASGSQSLSFDTTYALASPLSTLTGNLHISFMYDGATWRETSRSQT